MNTSDKIQELFNAKGESVEIGKNRSWRGKQSDGWLTFRDMGGFWAVIYTLEKYNANLITNKKSMLFFAAEFPKGNVTLAGNNPELRKVWQSTLAGEPDPIDDPELAEARYKSLESYINSAYKYNLVR